jgi:hypothetical protein
MAKSKPRATRSRKTFAWRQITAVIIGVLFIIQLMPWARSYIDNGRSDCTFGGITVDGFRQLLAQAKAQPWHVVSSDLDHKRVPGPGPMQSQDAYPIADKLLERIRKLAPMPSRSTDEELAAAHAVMLSIGAELVRIERIGWNTRAKENAYFLYLLPKRRLTHFCFACFVWPYVGIEVGFGRSTAADEFSLHSVRYVTPWFDISNGTMMNPGGEERNAQGECPAFPLKCGDKPSRRYI